MSFANNSDHDWETWGEKNPYFGVLSDPKFLDNNLKDDTLQNFFDSGENHIDHIYRVIHSSLQPDFQPNSVLDYGCGVGRLVIPFAQRSQTVVGVDISPSMLKRAQENCNKFGATSARLLTVDQLDSLAPSSFDFVHSFIVFQHIPVASGELILRKLISLIAEGGIGAIHLTYADTGSLARRALFATFKHVNLAHRLYNLLRRRPFSTPLMQMNCYSMNRIFDILMETHCSNVHVEFSAHGFHHGAMLYFEKAPRPNL